MRCAAEYTRTRCSCSNGSCMQGHDAHDHAHTHPMLPRFIEVVDFGNYELHTWYHSPLPPPFGTMRHLFVCPFTLKYFRKRKLLDAHISAIPTAARHPPGYVQYTSPDPPPPEASTDEGMAITAVCDPKVCVHCCKVLTQYLLPAGLSIDVYMHVVLCASHPVNWLKELNVW